MHDDRPQQDPADRTAPGVVVGVDGTETALRAVAWAAVEARLRGTPLQVVHAAPYAVGQARSRRAAAVLARAYTVARRREPGVETHTTRLDEAPAPALARAARDAHLLVVGMLSGHPGDGLVRSVAPAVVACAPCPVTVVRFPHGAEGSSGAVVAGVQDVGLDGPVLDEAFADADRHGCPLTVLHAEPGPDRPGEGSGPAGALHAALAPWRERHPDVPVDVRVEVGAPVGVLLHASHRARNLVIGTRGRSGAVAVLVGSTSRTLLSGSGCPVTVVHRAPVTGREPATRPDAAVGSESG